MTTWRPQFKFSPAISFVANCNSEEEVDELWQKLTEGGEEGQCGWLTDKYRVSWQVVPTALYEMFGGENAAASQRAFSAMLGMKKLDILSCGEHTGAPESYRGTPPANGKEGLGLEDRS